MLGIDIIENFLRIVSLQQRDGHFELQGTLKIPLTEPEASSPDVLGKKLGEALVCRGWQSQEAVLTLGHRLGIVRRLPMERFHEPLAKYNGSLSRAAIEEILGFARQSILLPTEEMIFDLWRSSGGDGQRRDVTRSERGGAGTVLLAATEKSGVAFFQKVAATAGLKIHALALRSMAKINGLLLHWHDAREQCLAVLHVEGQQAELAVVDTGGVVMLQSVSFDPKGDRQSTSNDDLDYQVQRAFNTIRLSSEGKTPERIFVAHSGADETETKRLAEHLGETLGVTASTCLAWGDFLVQADGKDKTLLAEFIPALGAALDGLEASPTRFDFQHPCLADTQKRRKTTWKPFAIMAALCLLVMVGFWFTLVQQRHHQLRELETQIAESQPARVALLDDQRNWNLFRRYVSTARDGARLSYLNILYQITRLFPDTDKAYVTRFTVSNRPSPAMGYEINIEGNVVTGGEVVTDFIAKLNNSQVFQEAQSGSLDFNPTVMFYSTRFSVTCFLPESAEETGP